MRMPCASTWCVLRPPCRSCGLRRIRRSTSGKSAGDAASRAPRLKAACTRCARHLVDWNTGAGQGMFSAVSQLSPAYGPARPSAGL